MKYLLLCLVLVSFMACTTEPRPINYGEDVCYYCKMNIVDRQHAAEAVTHKGRVYTFDAIECMLNYVNRHGNTGAYKFLLVNNYLDPGAFVPALESHYLISEEVPSPMGAFLSAFPDEESARSMQEKKGGQTFDWNELMAYGKTEGLIN
jgi:copper chaperone NosL